MRKPYLNLKKKLHSRSGETIAETLVTMIILSVAVLMLAGAVVTAARVNKQADNADTSFQTGNAISFTYMYLNYQFLIHLFFSSIFSSLEIPAIVFIHSSFVLYDQFKTSDVNFMISILFSLLHNST